MTGAVIHPKARLIKFWHIQWSFAFASLSILLCQRHPGEGDALAYGVDEGYHHHTDTGEGVKITLPFA